jgi:predicted SAM-dependent methyltransferase
MTDTNYKHYMRPQGKGLKLHLGCGDYWYDGYLNIDIGIYGGTDMLWDITKGLPFQPETVEIIEMYEVLEHLEQGQVDHLIDEFRRLLIDGGMIILSVPDMDELVNKYNEDKQQAITYIYGFGGYQSHKWGYSQETLKKLFEDKGFKEVNVIKGELPERKGEAKLILTCKK